MRNCFEHCGSRKQRPATKLVPIGSVRRDLPEGRWATQRKSYEIISNIPERFDTQRGSPGLKLLIQPPSSQIGAEGKGKGQAKGFIKTLASQIEAERQRQRPSQGVYKNALRPATTTTTTTSAKGQGLITRK